MLHRTEQWTAVVVGLACAACIAVGRADAQCTYDVTIIQQSNCAFGGPTTGLALNGLGHVVGFFRCIGQETQAFLWTPEAGVINLKKPPGTDRSRAHARAGDG